MSRDLLDSMDRFALEQIERVISTRDPKAGANKGLSRQAAAGTRS
jgi:hypothetical protein